MYLSYNYDLVKFLHWQMQSIFACLGIQLFPNITDLKFGLVTNWMTKFFYFIYFILRNGCFACMYNYVSHVSGALNSWRRLDLLE